MIIQHNIVNYFLPSRFAAITIWPFIFVRSDVILTPQLENHERIHLVQQKELLIFGFFLLYLFEYFTNLLRFPTADEAYRNISFEREAYSKENYLTYLQFRKSYSWIDYGF